MAQRPTSDEYAKMDIKTSFFDIMSEVQTESKDENLASKFERSTLTLTLPGTIRVKASLQFF
jgi:hypothetical protein